MQVKGPRTVLPPGTSDAGEIRSFPASGDRALRYRVVAAPRPRHHVLYFHGTALLTEMARRLAVPSVYLIANKVVGRLDPDEVETRIKEAFQYEVIGVLPLSEAMAGLGSRGLFCVECPSDPLAAELGRIADRLMSRGFDSGKN